MSFDKRKTEMKVTHKCWHLPSILLHKHSQLEKQKKFNFSITKFKTEVLITQKERKKKLVLHEWFSRNIDIYIGHIALNNFLLNWPNFACLVPACIQWVKLSSYYFLQGKTKIKTYSYPQFNGVKPILRY